MRRIPAIFVAMCASALLAGAASAVEIQNEDDNAYEVTVSEGQDTSTFTLGPGMSEPELCEAKCIVRVDGLGEIEVEPDDVVLIRRGALTKRM